MTAIQPQHRPAHGHLWWWYAAGAVLTAAVLTLVLTTLHLVYGGSDTPSPGINDVAVPYRHHAPACFAGRPGATGDLTRSGCPTAP